MKKSHILKFMSLWPPMLGAGIRIKRITSDFMAIDVEMKLRFWNQNYVGTQFGGSLYAMTDPFYMLMLLETLGHDYIVWDKSASIRFKRPGKGRVQAHFRLTREQVEHIRHQADTSDKVEPSFKVEVIDDAGQVIAEVEKVLYVRRKDHNQR